MCELQCGLLQDVDTYQPDTLDLNKDVEAAEFWFPCFGQMIKKFANQAAASQRDEDSTAVDRAEQMRQAYLEKLEDYKKQTASNAAKRIVLGVRELLELHERELKRFGFDDPWQTQKKLENESAIRLLEKRLQEVDSIADADQRWTELVRGVLAGNMFDWGAQEAVNIMENDSKFGLHAALDRIEKRPWLMDNLDAWLERLQCDKPHKCAAVFVDNSGADIVLGILPFVRELLKRGSKVILCANTEPSLNDVTSAELTALLDTCSCHCSVLAEAWSSKRLLAYGNGQSGPCLDMRKLPLDLCNAIRTNETDLLVIEGMGRALHTNLYAKFNCETLKLAVIKNQWWGRRLGGTTFSVICRYERS